MIIGNKPIPPTWTNEQKHLKIVKKILKNEDLKTIAFTNMRNNILKEEYNKKLKKSLPNILKKYQKGFNYEYDNDLITLASNKKSNNHSVKRFKSLNDEFEEIIKKQNIRVEPYKPDSIKENLNNILDYRKKIALRFKYNNKEIYENNKRNLILPKSRSQLVNSILGSKYNTVSTSNDNSSLNRVKNPHYMKNSNSTISKRLVMKDYEDKFLITGINHKEFNNNKNIEENLKYNKNNGKNAKKSLSAFNF